ncbi:MFS transporter [Halobacteria archaeon AArc-dxtr1]|nr:MFS transporter [Halobacteria archaeon AArc-dxtr1]
MNDNDRSILSITMVGHGMVHAYELSIPIFVTIWMSELGLDPAVIGVVVAAGYACYGIGALPGGIATDAYGSRGPMVGCLLGMGIAFLLLGLSSGLLGITLALLLWGVAASVYHPAGLRLISTGVTERGAGFAWHGIAGNAGIALGPLLTALLLLAFDWRLVAALMAIPALAAAVYTAAVSVDETAVVDEAPSTDGSSTAFDFLRDSRILFAGGFLVVFPIVVLEGFFYRGVLTFLPDVLADYPALSSMTIAELAVEPAQYVYAGFLGVGMAGQYVGGQVSDRYEPARALVVAFLALALLSVLFVPVASVGLLALLAISAALSFVLFGEQPLLQAVVANHSRSDVRGLSYGYMFLGAFGVGALGAAASGAILAYATQQVLFLLLALVPTAAAVVSALLAARKNR